MPQQVAPSEFPPLRDERRWPGRHIPLAFVEDDLDDRPPQPSKLMDIDYLDAQLGLKAPGSEDAPPPKPPAWRLRGRLGSVGNETDVPREVRAVPVPDSREPVEPREAQRSREEREPRQSGEARLGSTHASPSPWVPWAIAFAVIALASAVLAHALAPIALTGYSTPELDVTVRMRALEWLLAGNLVAMVGLLLKR